MEDELLNEIKMYVKVQFRKSKCEFDEKISQNIFTDFEDHELYENSLENQVKKFIETEWTTRWNAHCTKTSKIMIESDPNEVTHEMYRNQIATLQSTITTMEEKFSKLSNTVTMLLEKNDNKEQKKSPTVVEKKAPVKTNRVSRKKSFMTIKKQLENERENAVSKWSKIDKYSDDHTASSSSRKKAFSFTDRDTSIPPLTAPQVTITRSKPMKKNKKKSKSKKKKLSSTISFKPKNKMNKTMKKSKSTRNIKQKGYELKKQSFEDTDESRKITLRYGSRQYTALAPETIPEGLDVTPEENLELSYAHGFNGHYPRCRNNLLQREDKLVYNLAGAIVIHDIDDNEQRFFTKHTEDITSIAMHPTLPVMATGQLDEKGVRMPRICIWNLDTLELIREIEGFHKNAIYHLAFSTNTGYLYSCSGDCDCTLLVFDLDSTKIKPIFEYSPISKGEVYGLVLCENLGPKNGSSMIDEFITYGAKHLKTWEVKDENNVGMGPKQLRLHGHLIPTTKTSINKKTKTIVEKAFQTAITVPSSPSTYIVGANSGIIYLVQYHQVKKRINAFDSCPVTCAIMTENGFLASSLKGEFIRYQQDVENVTKFKEYLRGDFSSSIENISGTGSAHALQYDQNEKVLYVGSHRSQIFSVDFSRLVDEHRIKGEVMINGHSNEIWGLATHPERPMFVTCGYDGKITCWDAHTNLPMIEKTIETNEKFTCMAWSNDANLIAVGTESSKIYLIDFESFDIVHKEVIVKKHKSSPVEQIGCVCFSPENDILIAGHYDSSIYVFDVIQKKRKSYLKSWSKHGNCHKTSACTHVQFSEDGKLFKSFGRDYDIQYWSVRKTTKNVALHPYLVDFNEIKFVGSPILAGWDTQGLLQKGMDGTDINTCSVTNSKNHEKGKQLLVCGDDFGKVWLHNYPALDHTKTKAFSGHSAFVVDVKWTPDDTKVISIGGGDQAIFVWNKI